MIILPGLQERMKRLASLVTVCMLHAVHSGVLLHVCFRKPFTVAGYEGIYFAGIVTKYG